jgi:hypothetical protein
VFSGPEKKLKRAGSREGEGKEKGGKGKMGLREGGEGRESCDYF